MANNWYKTKFRRTLLDMHIEEWDPAFLSKYNPDDYFECLKEGNINAPMIYIQSHVGLCNWPTKSGKMHNSFRGREDTIRRLIDKCRQAGMDVIAYYSLIYNNWAYEQYPQWQMRDSNNHGSRFNGSRYGLCCPNSGGYRDFLKEQIAEFCDYFRLEGVFLDMTFWPMVCYCDSCRTRWQAETGNEMPEIVDWNDPLWIKFQEKRTGWLGEFAQFATMEIKKHKPDCTVEHQYSTAVNHFWRFGVTDNITLASDYAGGDLYGGIAEQSFACKAYYNLTRNQPFEYMTCRCYKSLTEHTTNKSDDLLRLSVMLTYMHHGACLLIDAIDPAGTMDKRVYQKIGEIFREAEPFEPYLSTGEHVYDAALYFNLHSKMDTLKNKIHADKITEDSASPHEIAILEAANSLRTHHIPYTVLNNWKHGLLPETKVLVLSDISFLTKVEQAEIEQYIQNGGSVYISGRSCPDLVEKIFKVKFEGYSKHTITYISPSDCGISVMQNEFTYKYPLAMFEQQALYSGRASGKIYGTVTLPYTIPVSGSREGGQLNRFASIHSNPPGIFTDKPAMMETVYGKGRVFYSSLPIERAGREQHSNIFAGIIKMLMGKQKPAFYSNDAPETAEFILFNDSEKQVKLLGIINIQESFKTIPLHDFSVSVYSEKMPGEVVLLPDKKPVSFAYDKDYVNIHIDRLDLYAMILLQF